MSDVRHILEERGQTHGPWVDQSAIAEALWKLVNCYDKRYTPSQAQALHMICGKLSRIAVGDHNEPDHWRDIAGYATLAADALDLLTPPTPGLGYPIGAPTPAHPHPQNDYGYPIGYPMGAPTSGRPTDPRDYGHATSAPMSYAIPGARPTDPWTTT